MGEKLDHRCWHCLLKFEFQSILSTRVQNYSIRKEFCMERSCNRGIHDQNCRRRTSTNNAAQKEIEGELDLSIYGVFGPVNQKNNEYSISPRFLAYIESLDYSRCLTILLTLREFILSSIRFL